MEDLLPPIMSGVLLAAGVAFALFLGIASNRIEQERERDLEALERERAANRAAPRHAA